MNLLKKSVVCFLLALTTVLTPFAAIAQSDSTTACSTFDIEFNYKKQGAKFWLIPDDKFKAVTLPIDLKAVSNNLRLEVRFRQKKNEILITMNVEFDGKKSIMETTMNLAAERKQHIHLLVDETTLDSWVFALTPTCGQTS
jgi:hypothetical protein